MPNKTHREASPTGRKFGRSISQLHATKQLDLRTQAPPPSANGTVRTLPNPERSSPPSGSEATGPAAPGHVQQPLLFPRQIATSPPDSEPGLRASRRSRPPTSHAGPQKPHGPRSLPRPWRQCWPWTRPSTPPATGPPGLVSPQPSGAPMAANLSFSGRGPRKGR
ncbi:uncharacterized protein LOC130840254 [Hippopotamus amphibius kiboko]|uniref:uncharacterized protein LOC130840254 n=1 Tax=Hippopotamus amphibius kiboko TaxID=575201 RepID=UPI00259450BF|nr:uncharacterized protein LOC130840254 [Hippopotamus amphibius kiboko]